MKAIREQLRAVLESEDEIRKIVIVYELRGKKARAVHNFDTTAKAIAFVSEALRLSDEELLAVIKGRA